MKKWLVALMVAVAVVFGYVCGRGAQTVTAQGMGSTGIALTADLGKIKQAHMDELNSRWYPQGGGKPLVECILICLVQDGCYCLY